MANNARGPRTTRPINLDEIPAVSKRNAKTNNYYNNYDEPPPQSTTPYTNRDRYSPIAEPPPPQQQTKRRPGPDPYQMETSRSRNDDRPAFEYDVRTPRMKPDNGQAEMYHIDTKGDNMNDPSPRATPGLMSNTNRISPSPYPRMMSPAHDRPELYHIDNGSPRENLPSTMDHYPPSSRMDEHREPSFDHPEHKKVTFYVLDASNENHLPDENRFRERTPSPPIQTKKKPLPPPVSYDDADDDYNAYETPRKPNPFPTPLQTVTSNVRYVPLSHSKASQSIQRSMMKYRFL